MATTACSLTSYPITLHYWGTGLFFKCTWLILPQFPAVPTAWNAFLWVCTHHTSSSLDLIVILVRSSYWDLSPGNLATKHPLLMYIQPQVKVDNIPFFSVIILKSSRNEFLKLKNQASILTPCTRIIVPLGLFKVMTSLRRLFSWSTNLLVSLFLFFYFFK